MTKKEFKAFGNEVSKARDKYEELLDLQKGLQSSDLWGKLGDQAQSAVEDAVSMAKAEADLIIKEAKDNASVIVKKENIINIFTK